MSWNLANRFITADSYSLQALAEKLKFNQLPTHQAIDHTLTTVELLRNLLPRLTAINLTDCQNIVNKYREKFEILAQKIEVWREASQEIRPAYLLGKILIDSGLYDYYQKEDNKHLENLKILVKLFQKQDYLELHPDMALRNLLEFTALAKNLDQISQNHNQVPIITVHQSKGLEFDTVFLAGVSEGEFPSYFSVKNGDIEEEKRLFYVAITRAKQRLFISGFLRDSSGYSKSLSQFINLISIDN